VEFIVDKKRTFILGLGHQKCGTSWLHKYLCHSDQFAEGYSKEFHVWDRKDIPLFAIKKIRPSARTFISRKRYQRYRMEASTNYYFSYFDKLMSGGKVISADISPSYCGLKSDRLEYIKQKFLEREIQTKVIILVREPLSHIKSAVRFNLDRYNYAEGISFNETDFDRSLNQYYRTEHCLIRTKYQNIISEVKNVFSSENVYIGFYENMFDRGEVAQLSEFLGVEPNFEFTKVKVNKTRNSVSTTDSDVKIKAYYANTYEYFYKNFEIANELWR
jgi:hypothetical protein